MASIALHFSCIFLRQGLKTNLELIMSPRLARVGVACLCSSTLGTGLAMPATYMVAYGLNSGLHACTASTLPNEPSFRPLP